MTILKTICDEHLLYRKQILKLAKSDLVKTYRGSALGWSWAFIKPMVTIFVYWFAFSYGIRSGGDVDGYPFFLWLIAGFVPWFYMSEMITQGAGCMRSNRHLITKMKFPISVIPTFTSLSKLTIHLILMAVTIVIFIAFGHMPITAVYAYDVYLFYLLGTFCRNVIGHQQGFSQPGEVVYYGDILDVRDYIQRKQYRDTVDQDFVAVQSCDHNSQRIQACIYR